MATWTVTPQVRVMGGQGGSMSKISGVQGPPATSTASPEIVAPSSRATPRTRPSAIQGRAATPMRTVAPASAARAAMASVAASGVTG